MNFDFLIPYIQYLVYILIGLIFLYFKTLITEKAKIKVLQKKNKELIEETEEIKKEHQLDIEKRKYQYESKKEQFIRFFGLLDKFNANSNSIMQEKMLPLIDEFNRNYLHATRTNNKKAETKAITVFSKKIQKLMFDANEDLTKLKQETNTIRLIASDSIINTLDLLELAYDNSFKESSKMLNEMPEQILNKDQQGMQKNQISIQASGNVILKFKNDLIQQMRKELGEI